MGDRSLWRSRVDRSSIVSFYGLSGDSAAFLALASHPEMQRSIISLIWSGRYVACRNHLFGLSLCLTLFGESFIITEG